MIIPPLGAQAVRNARIEANEKEYDAWNKRRHIALQYYNGETEDITRDHFSKELAAQIPVANNNITRRIIDRVSEVYMVETDRHFGENERANDYYHELTTRKYMRMQRIERMTNLLEVVAVRPMRRADGSLDYEYLVEFVPGFDTDGNLTSVMYPIRQSANIHAADEQEWVVWDEFGWHRMDANGVEKDSEAYNFFPWLLSWREEPPYFYDHLPSPDLIQSNLCINFAQTAMMANTAFQSFGQPFVTGLQEGQEQQLQWGIDKLPVLPEGASAGMLSPPSTVAGIIEAQKFLYKMIARSYHLPEDFVEGTTAESGVAIRLRNQELQNERRGDIARWRQFERALYEKELQLIGGGLHDSINIDFSESEEVLNPQEQMERDQWDLEHNLTTLVDIMRRRNPDLDEDQARQLLESNQEANAALAGQPKPQGSIIGELLGAGGE